MVKSAQILTLLTLFALLPLLTVAQTSPGPKAPAIDSLAIQSSTQLPDRHEVIMPQFRPDRVPPMPQFKPEETLAYRMPVFGFIDSLRTPKSLQNPNIVSEIPAEMLRSLQDQLKSQK